MEMYVEIRSGTNGQRTQTTYSYLSDSEHKLRILTYIPS